MITMKTRLNEKEMYNNKFLVAIGMGDGVGLISELVVGARVVVLEEVVVLDVVVVYGLQFQMGQLM